MFKLIAVAAHSARSHWIAHARLTQNAGGRPACENLIFGPDIDEGVVGGEGKQTATRTTEVMSWRMGGDTMGHSWSDCCSPFAALRQRRRPLGVCGEGHRRCACFVRWHAARSDPGVQRKNQCHDAWSTSAPVAPPSEARPYLTGSSEGMSAVASTGATAPSAAQSLSRSPT